MNRVSNFFGWISFFAISAIGEFAHAQTVNLFSLLEQSKTNYPLIKASLSEVTSAQQERSMSAMEYVPRISVQHQYTYATNNSISGSFYPNPTVISPSGGIRPENNYQPVWGSYTSAMMEWNIFNFGKVASQVQYAHSNVTNKQAAYNNEVFQNQVRVADAYLLTLIANRLAVIQNANVERALRFKQAVDAGVRSGVRPGVDSALANAEYTKANLLLMESEQNEKVQYYRLWELSNTQQTEGQVIDSMVFFNKLPNLAGIGEELAIANPVLQFYQTRKEATQARTKMIRRSFLPSLTLVGSVWARGSGISPADDSYKIDFASGTKYQVSNYLVGVATRWVISDFFSLHQKYRSEQSLLDRDTELLNHQNLKLKWQLNENNMKYKVALEQARIAPIQLIAAQQAYAQANARYKSGLTDLPTFLQSLVTLNRAEADYAIAYSNAWRALLALAATQGDLAIFLNAVQD